MIAFRSLRFNLVVIPSVAFGFVLSTFVSAPHGAPAKCSAEQRRKPLMRESVVVVATLSMTSSTVDGPQQLSMSPAASVATAVATAAAAATTTARAGGGRSSCAKCQIVPRAGRISPQAVLRDVAPWPAAARTSSHRCG
jgi:hypothetical protein